MRVQLACMTMLIGSLQGCSERTEAAVLRDRRGQVEDSSGGTVALGLGGTQPYRPMTGVRATTAVLVFAVVAALWFGAGGPRGIAYAIVYALAVLPGFPLGFALFGRRSAAGWIAGALLGYGTTQLALWAAIAAGAPSASAFLIAWLLALSLTWAISRSVTQPLVTGTWTQADWRALVLVLLLVPALMGPPYRNLGRPDEHGNRYYRAYFTADFLWHTALGSELGKFSLPPRNPYLSPRPMNYYWTYFLLPSAVAVRGPGPLQDIQSCLKANAILSGMLMVAALFLLVRTAVNTPAPAAIAVALAILAASAEGTYAIADLIARDRPLAQLADTNIDAITAWHFGGLRIDNIARSLWYTPQHTMAVALGLVGLVIAAETGAAASLPGIAGAGIALGLATTMNPLLGGVFSVMYGIAITADGLRMKRGLTYVARHVVAAVPVGLAVLWSAAGRVADGAGAALQFGFAGFSRNRPVLTLMLSLGPLLVPAVAGVVIRRRRPSRPAVIASAGLVIGLVLLYSVRISEASWVGFRAGQVLLVSLPVLLAPLLEQLRYSARAALIGAILVAGLPTTIVDAWNAQDIGNRRNGPGFRWTLWTTRDQNEAFEWIKRNTESTAIVQMEPVVRGREHWTLIPSFAGRRMAAGLPISLLPLPEYRERSERVRTLFATGDVAEAVRIAHSLRINYLYVDDTDTAAYGASARKFDDAPAFFERVFANPQVRIYRVR